MRVLLCLLACLILVSAGTVCAKESPIRILMLDTEENYTSFYYKKRGADAGAVNTALMNALMTALPCATWNSMSETRELLKWDKLKTLLSSNPDASNLEEILANATSADYAVSSTFGNMGDERHWLLSVSVLDLRKNRASAKAVATGEGSVDVVWKLIKQVADEIAESNICPWMGTISIKKTSSLDTASTVVTTGENSSTTTKESIVDKKHETWTIEAVAGKYATTWGEGTVTQTTKYFYQRDSKETGKLSCFRSDKPCSIVDDRMPSSFDNYLGHRKENTDGSRKFDRMKVKVSFASDSAFVSLEGDPLGVGVGTAEEYEMKENACHKCVVKDEKGDVTGAAWGARIFGGPAKRPIVKISGQQTIKEGREVTEIVWNLHK